MACLESLISNSRGITTRNSDDGKWIFYGEVDVPYPSCPWNPLTLEDQLLVQLLKLEKSFLKKKLQYESLQREFEEVFQDEELTDGEDGESGEDG